MADKWILFLMFWALTIAGHHVVPKLAAQVTSQQEEKWTPARRQDMKSRLTDLHTEQDFNGTVLLAHGGEIQFLESVGYSNFATKKKLDKDASFRLASVSKQFTAMAVMILKKQGKIQYDDAITKHIPELPYENVTIRNLLNHTSGLEDYMIRMNRHWEPSKPLNERTIAFNKDVVAHFAEHKPKLRFEPGQKFEYSNTGYVFLGHLIDTVSDVGVRKFIRDSIFKPLKMNRSYVYSPGPEFSPEHRVYGFRYLKREPGFRPNDDHYLNGMVGDGGIYCSATDLLKWDQALYGEELVTQEELQLAFKPSKLTDGSETDYGFGWSIDINDGQQLKVSHGGAWVGFITYISRDVTKQRTTIILTNHSSRGLPKVMKAIARIPESP